MLALLLQVRVQGGVQFADFEDAALGCAHLVELIFVLFEQVRVFLCEELELLGGELGLLLLGGGWVAVRGVEGRLAVGSFGAAG